MNGTETSLAAALTLGLLGSSHCLVMCGGISAALGMGTATHHRYRLLLLFQFGRIITYMALGAGLGAIVSSATGLSEVLLPPLRILSGALLVAMGLYVANVWAGLTWLEAGGKALWRHIEPLAQRRLPVSRSVDALAVGLYWGFLPCGLIYTALAWTATAADWRQSALLMGAFGLGTLPAMLATGVAAQRIMGLLGKRGLRRIAGSLLVVAGLWTAWIGLQHAGHGGHGGADRSEDISGDAAPHSHHNH
ncbi:MAG: sulfite exporter TauE/SafE family protein [Halieaceae bacterium]|nr:sulfite exporter TauE/SafE family protein [Halieaceae bacterium]